MGYPLSGKILLGPARVMLAERDSLKQKSSNWVTMATDEQHAQ